jgi:DNA invertase Pin-like site-specific DNA recombinase
VLVVWKLDRLGTSIKELVATMTFLEERRIGFQSLTDAIDTTSRGGTQVFRLFRALRNVMREKTKAGRRVARAKGRKGGRPTVLTGKQRSIAKELYDKKHPIAEICRTLKISRATLYRALKTGERDQ